MNIVHMQLTGGIGGIETLSLNIANHSKHNNIFYYVFEGGAIADKIAENNQIELANSRHSSYLGSAKKFVEFCKKNNADVVICHHGAPILRYMLWYSKRHNKKAKHILYLHSNAKDSFYQNKIKNIISKFVLKKAHKSSDYTVAISKSVKQSFIDLYGFDENKTKVVYNGVDISRFYSNRNDTDNEFKIIYVGRLLSVKGIHVLINAISKIDNNIPIAVSIVGTGDDEYLEKIEKLAKEKNVDYKVKFLGARHDIPDLLADADLFVHPAIWDEGFGITIAEALASSIPCIAFNKGAMFELIDNGENGFLVDDVKASALAKAITNAYEIYKSGEYSSFRQKAKEKSQLFTIENTVKDLEKLYG